MKKLAVLISDTGTGTNLNAIIDAVAQKQIDAVVSVVVSDTKDAKGLHHADKNRIPIEIIDRKTDVTKLLTETFPVDYVCLCGWKQIIPEEFINAFPNKILNLHPGLIPDTIHGVVKNPDGTDALWNKGKLADAAIGNFLQQKASYAGSSVHFLTREFDYGPVLGRTFEKIQPGDTVDSLYKRLKQKENNLYVECLKKLCNKKLYL